MALKVSEHGMLSYNMVQLAPTGSGCAMQTMSYCYARLFSFYRQLPAPRPTNATSPASKTVTLADKGTSVSKVDLEGKLIAAVHRDT
jgi:hypothetical protein